MVMMIRVIRIKKVAVVVGADGREKMKVDLNLVVESACFNT